MEIISSVQSEDWKLNGNTLSYKLDYPLFPARDEDRKRVEDNGGGDFYNNNGEWRYKKPQEIEVPKSLVSVISAKVGETIYLEIDVEEVPAEKENEASAFKRSLIGVYNLQEVVEKQRAAIAAVKQ